MKLITGAIISALVFSFSSWGAPMNKIGECHGKTDKKDEVHAVLFVDKEMK